MAKGSWPSGQRDQSSNRHTQNQCATPLPTWARTGVMFKRKI